MIERPPPRACPPGPEPGGKALFEAARQSRVSPGGEAVPVEEIERAIEALAILSARQAQVVEMRFFGELGFSELAACLGISADAARRDWRIGRAWLNRALARGLLDEGDAR